MERDHQIHELYSAGLGAFRITQQTGFPIGSVNNAIKRNGWKLGAADNPPPKPTYGKRAKPKPKRVKPRKLLAAARKHLILRLAETGERPTTIARRVGCNQSYVSRVLNSRPAAEMLKSEPRSRRRASK